MPYQRGDVIEVNLAMPPDGKIMNHPAVIISNNQVYEDDACYIVVMLTSQDYDDNYSYPIDNYMFLQGSNSSSHSEARCHLITYVLDAHIIGTKRNRLKKRFVDEIVDQVADRALLGQ